MIKVTNLWKSYGKQMVLKGLSLEVKRGETLVILGRSGVGKSVLLRQLIGLEKPDKGKIEIEGKDIFAIEPDEFYKILRQMGMLFQGSALFDSMNVALNTGFYLRQHEDPQTGKMMTPEQIKTRVVQTLKLVGLEEAYDRMPSDLSGGMRKRCALARLIAYRPNILLYDEPTTGLDPITSMHINELIRTIQKELKATSIVVTHDVRAALAVGDRLAFHNNGVIAYIADKKTFMKTENPDIQKFLEAALPLLRHPL